MVREYFGDGSRWNVQIEYVEEDEDRPLGTAGPLGLLPPQQRPGDFGLDDQELAQPTIFPLLIRHGGRALSPADCRKIYRALARDRGRLAVDDIVVSRSATERLAAVAARR